MLEPRTRAVAANLLRALRFFGQARADGEIRDLPGVSLISCGLNYAAFNAALIAEPIETDSRELAHMVEVSAKLFDARNVRWTFWICEDFLGKPVRREGIRILEQRGLRPLTEAAGMYAECLAPPVRPLPDLEILEVSGERTRKAFAEIMSVGFDIPLSICTAIYASERAWKSDLRGYVGYANGCAVTTAAAIITGDVIGLYSVATVPQHRRVGYAEAIMRWVIGEARRTAGIENTVLQATRSGFHLYERMGYRKVTNFNVFIAD